MLEGGRVGWGASGRNGGQMIPGLRKGAAELVKTLGVERARALLDLAFEARDLVVGLIAEYAIACDLKTTGHLLGAAKARRPAMDGGRGRACLATVMAYPHVDLLSAAQARGEVATDYHGGLVDRRGGHMHPLNYTLGLARAARPRRRARSSTNSEVTGLEDDRRRRDPRGRPACAGEAGDAGGRRPAATASARQWNARIMPVANYLVATAPLADPARSFPTTSRSPTAASWSTIFA